MSESMKKSKVDIKQLKTSETFRLTETPTSSSSSTTSARKKVMAMNSSNNNNNNITGSSFQVTSVSVIRSEFGDDSADDLDESHTDDYSEDSRDEQLLLEAQNLANMKLESTEIKPVTVANINANPNVAKPPIKSRFKSVKVAEAPYVRGRWTCVDYPSSNSHSNAISTDNNNQIHSVTVSHEQHQNADLNLNPIVDNNNQQQQHTGLSHHYQNNSHRTEYQSRVTTRLSSGDDSLFNSALNLQVNHFIAEHLPHQSGDNFSISNIVQNRLQNDAPATAAPAKSSYTITSSIQNNNNQGADGGFVSASPSSASDDGSNTNEEIDKKIELALDTVKSHLMLAVQLEINYLKNQIIRLERRVSELENENFRLTCLLK